MSQGSGAKQGSGEHAQRSREHTRGPGNTHRVRGHTGGRGPTRQSGDTQAPACPSHSSCPLRLLRAQPKGREGLWMEKPRLSGAGRGQLRAGPTWPPRRSPFLAAGRSAVCPSGDSWWPQRHLLTRRPGGPLSRGSSCLRTSGGQPLATGTAGPPPQVVAPGLVCPMCC